MKKLILLVFLSMFLGVQQLIAAPTVRLQTMDRQEYAVDPATLNSPLVNNALRLLDQHDLQPIVLPIGNAPTLEVLQHALGIHAATDTNTLTRDLQPLPIQELVQIINVYDFMFGRGGWSADHRFFNRFQSPDVNFTTAAQFTLDKIIREFGSRQPPERELADDYVSVLDKDDAVLWRFIEYYYQNEIVSKSSWDSQALVGHTGWANSVAWSPDGKMLASGSMDGTVKFWDVAGRNCIATMSGPGRKKILSVAWSPNGEMIATASSIGSVDLWRVANHEWVTTFPTSGLLMGASVAWSPDGQTLAIGSSDETVKLWNIANHANIATLAGHDNKVKVVERSPDGNTLAIGSANGTVKLWNIADHADTVTLEDDVDGVYAIAWSPDGKTLATGSANGTVRLWNIADHTCIATLTGHEDLVAAIAWRPDGQILATGSWDSTVKLWNVADRTCITTLKRHLRSVYSVAWNPDGKILATGAAAKTIGETVKLWYQPLAGVGLTTIQKLLLLKFARQQPLPPTELSNLQPLIDALPAPAREFVASRSQAIANF